MSIPLGQDAASLTNKKWLKWVFIAAGVAGLGGAIWWFYIRKRTQ